MLICVWIRRNYSKLGKLFQSYCIKYRLLGWCCFYMYHIIHCMFSVCKFKSWCCHHLCKQNGIDIICWQTSNEINVPRSAHWFDPVCFERRSNCEKKKERESKTNENSECFLLRWMCALSLSFACSLEHIHDSNRNDWNESDAISK